MLGARRRRLGSNYDLMAHDGGTGGTMLGRNLGDITYFFPTGSSATWIPATGTPNPTPIAATAAGGAGTVPAGYVPPPAAPALPVYSPPAPAQLPIYQPPASPIPTHVTVTPPAAGFTAVPLASPTPTEIQQAVNAGYAPTTYVPLPNQPPASPTPTQIQQAVNAGYTPTAFANLTPVQQQQALAQAAAFPSPVAVSPTPSGRAGGGGGSSGGTSGGGARQSGGTPQPATQPRQQPLISFGLTAQPQTGYPAAIVPGVPAPGATAAQIAATGLSPSAYAALSPAQQAAALQHAGNTVTAGGAVLTPAQVSLLEGSGYTPAEINSLTPAQKTAAVNQAAAQLTPAQQAQITGYTPAQWSQMSAAAQSQALQQSGVTDAAGFGNIPPVVWIIGGVLLLMMLSGGSESRTERYQNA